MQENDCEGLQSTTTQHHCVQSFVDATAHISSTHLVIASNQLRQHIETVIAVDGGSNELCHPWCVWSSIQSVVQMKKCSIFGVCPYLHADVVLFSNTCCALYMIQIIL